MGVCVRVCLTDGQTKRVCSSRHEVNNRFERNQRFFVPAVLEEKRKKERTWERTPTLQSHSTRSINRPDWSRSLSQLSLYPLTLLHKHASSHTNTLAHASKHAHTHTHTHTLSLSLSFCFVESPLLSISSSKNLSTGVQTKRDWNLWLKERLKHFFLASTKLQSSELQRS